MLDTFRKNTKLIIWSVILAFVLWGGVSVGTQFQSQGQYAGKVFGKNVSFQEYDQFYKASQIFRFGGQDLQDPSILRQSAWQGITLSREAKKQKIAVSDDEVRQQILKLLAEQKVDPANYLSWVERSLGETPKQFENQIREILRIQKFIAKLAESETASEITLEEAKKSFLQENNQLAAEIRRFPTREEASEFRGNLKTPDDWKKQKEAKPEAFQQTGMVPEEAFKAIMQIAPEDISKIDSLEKDHFSEALSMGKEFAVIYVTDRKTADEKDFEAQKDKYLESLKERSKQEKLMQKTHEILNRAQLKDYLPAAESVSA